MDPFREIFNNQELITITIHYNKFSQTISFTENRSLWEKKDKLKNSKHIPAVNGLIRLTASIYT